MFLNLSWVYSLYPHLNLYTSSIQYFLLQRILTIACLYSECVRIQIFTFMPSIIERFAKVKKTILTQIKQVT